MAEEKTTGDDAEDTGAGAQTADPAQDEPDAGPADSTVRRYPDYLMDFPPDLSPEQARRWQRFFDLREDILLDYSYQTGKSTKSGSPISAARSIAGPPG